MTIKGKITNLGLGPMADILIAEGCNKTELHRALNEELEKRGKKPITYECASQYFNKWFAERDRKAMVLATLTEIPTGTPEWGYDIARSIIKQGQYNDELAKAMTAAIDVENGLINTMKFYSAIVLAGLAKVLQHPENVSVADAMKAAALLGEIKQGGSKTVLQQAIQINQGGVSAMNELLREAATIEAEFEVQ